MDALKALGISSAFSLESADFSGMTDAPAFISGVKQETHISIDENGVEASAFTEIAYAGAAMPEDQAEMILDRPFIYGITAGNGTLLFVGVCMDPAS
jgi:serine protease inhibitor